jgi:hypothetical protein
VRRGEREEEERGKIGGGGNRSPGTNSGSPVANSFTVVREETVGAPEESPVFSESARTVFVEKVK